MVNITPTTQDEWWTLYDAHLDNILLCNDRADTGIEADLIKQICKDRNDFRATVVLDTIQEMMPHHQLASRLPSWIEIHTLRITYPMLFKAT